LILTKAAGASDPAAFSTSKPWAYWWWPGSAVSEKGITHNLEFLPKRVLAAFTSFPFTVPKATSRHFYLS